ncbi:MAG: VOC family protein [Bacteroidota bacterium]
MSAILQSKAIDLAQSQSFYQRLNFQLIEQSEKSYVSDGKVIIELHTDRFARSGVQLYRSTWEAVLPRITPTQHIVDIEGGHLLSAPSGCWIYLMNGPAPFTELPQSDQATFFGNCAGLSLETTDMVRSIHFWEILGFKKTMGAIEQGWIGLANAEGFGLSIMKALACPHSFYNPSLSYFNGKNNLALIAKIRATGLPITEEITVFNPEGIVDNIIMRDPGGFGFFIFSD